MSLGPLMMDLQGTSLVDEEREMLRHPLVGGIILFSRNYECLEQLVELTKELHSLRDPHLIIAVDHEGGRVQRFRQGFTEIPAMAVFGEMYKTDSKQAEELAVKCGWLLAAEVLACGIDISFAPVLDISHGVSGVIGDRAFSGDPEIVAKLAIAVMRGMRQAGMSATGKHFPGHGGVKEDSHIARPVDQRSLADLRLCDVIPFERLIHAGLAGIMPAHVIYASVDEKPAGYSKCWLRDILRNQLGFQGVIFSDDLSMEAADCGDSYLERAQRALEAGCDMILVCNHAQAASEVLDSLGSYNNPASQLRLVRMHGHFNFSPVSLRATAEWKAISKQISHLNDNHSLQLEL